MGYLKSLTVLLCWCRVTVICRGQGGRLALVLPSLDTSQEHALTSSVVPPMRSMFVELVSDLPFSLSLPAVPAQLAGVVFLGVGLWAWSEKVGVTVTRTLSISPPGLFVPSSKLLPDEVRSH